MDFPPQHPRPYTRLEVLNLAENQTGCYGLLSGREMICVGRGDIRQRLLDHLNGDNLLIRWAQPTHFVTLLTPFPVHHERELILLYKPRCNRRVG